ncbi:DUF3291 domain-containing protein [Virgisporangium ochraceum]|nr:DUF3291 domain-containing protein [Virgisporangium ochraceum]
MLLAQVNVALMRADMDDPRMGGFVAALDPVYRMAEESRGFVWRLRDPGGGHRPATSGGQVVNVSVWRTYRDLHAFVYRSRHGAFVKERQRWFLPTPQPSTALWWVADAARPTLEQALARLAHLRRHGPTPRAFGVRRRFDPSGRTEGRPPVTHAREGRDQ